jgi:hypothetical protein
VGFPQRTARLRTSRRELGPFVANRQDLPTAEYLHQSRWSADIEGPAIIATAASASSLAYESRLQRPERRMCVLTSQTSFEIRQLSSPRKLEICASRVGQAGPLGVSIGGPVVVVEELECRAGLPHLCREGINDSLASYPVLVAKVHLHGT